MDQCLESGLKRLRKKSCVDEIFFNKRSEIFAVAVSFPKKFSERPEKEDSITSVH